MTFKECPEGYIIWGLSPQGPGSKTDLKGRGILDINFDRVQAIHYGVQGVYGTFLKKFEA
jgi:hypothetical protein